MLTLRKGRGILEFVWLPLQEFAAWRHGSWSRRCRDGGEGGTALANGHRENLELEGRKT